MPVTTLKNAAKELGVSLDDTVYYYIKDNKGIIEINLAASDTDIEQSAVNDVFEDYLTQDELDYYLSLDEK